MAHLKLLWIGFHFGSLLILVYISHTWALSILELPLPPVPVNRTLTRSLGHLENGTSPQCSTDDGEVLSLTRNGMIAGHLRWSGSFVVYPDPSYDDRDRGIINDAMWTLWQALPCLHFGIWPRDATPWGDYVHIKKGNGCWAQVGRQGGVQDMSLQSPYCMNRGSVMHEMIHALGFHHEHCRPDRDDHVNILWHNVASGSAYNFHKYSESAVTSHGVPYNQRSIMHYRSTDFSGNGWPTIEAKDGGYVGSLGELQQTDIDKLRRMYHCY